MAIHSYNNHDIFVFVNTLTMYIYNGCPKSRRHFDLPINDKLFVCRWWPDVVVLDK